MTNWKGFGNGLNRIVPHLRIISGIIIPFSALLVVLSLLGFSIDLPNFYRSLGIEEKISVLAFLNFAISLLILLIGFTYVMNKINDKKLIDMDKAKEIATHYAKGHFGRSKINIVSAKLDEVSGIAIYEVTGDAISSTEERKSFIVQIELKTGKVSGFKEGQSAKDLYSIA